MEKKWNRETAVLTISLPDKMDSVNIQNVEDELLDIYAQYQDQAELVILDARDLIYLSSAGIRCIMKLRKVSHSIVILNANTIVYETLTLTGLNDLMEVLPTVREISLEDCTILGSGRNGTVYRLNEDTICKVFRQENSLRKVLMEKRMSRIVFRMGLNAELSFQIVKAGKYWGLLYELINGRTLGELIRNEPDDLDHYLEKYLAFLDTIHAVRADKELPDKKSEFGNRVIAAVIPELDAVHGKMLETVFRSIPEGKGFVHGDPQFANVFYAGEEWYIIDMDSVGSGNEIWDMVALHGTLVGFQIFNPEDIMHLGSVKSYGSIWEKLLERWAASGGRDRDQAGRMIEALSLARVTAFARRHGLDQEIPGLKDRLSRALDGIDQQTFE